MRVKERFANSTVVSAQREPPCPPTCLRSSRPESSAALVATSAIGVLAGSLAAEYLNPRYLQIAAGIGFITIGVWTLFKA